MVYFPYPSQRGALAGLRRSLRRQLATQFLLPTWREGVYGESAVGESVTGARLLAPGL